MAVDGSVLHRVLERDAAMRIRSEIRHPSLKKDAVGMRSLDDLDDILGELVP